MKNYLALLGMTLGVPLAVVGAPAGGDLLIKADSVTFEGERHVATGHATLASKDGDTRVSADRIIYERAGEIVTFSGAVRIQTGAATFETTEATLDLHGRRVFLLSSGRLTLGGEGPAFEAKAGAVILGTFAEPFPKTETQLPTTMPKARGTR